MNFILHVVCHTLFFAKPQGEKSLKYGEWPTISTVGQVACSPLGVLARYSDEEVDFPSIWILLFLRAGIFRVRDVNFEKRKF